MTWGVVQDPTTMTRDQVLAVVEEVAKGCSTGKEIEMMVRRCFQPAPAFIEATYYPDAAYYSVYFLAKWRGEGFLFTRIET